MARQKPEQQHLPGEGMAPKRVRAVHDAAEKYQDAKMERVAASKKETAARDRLVEKLKGHGLTAYTDDSFAVKLKPGVDKLEVHPVSEDDDEAADAE